MTSIQDSPILAPVVALIAWSLIIWLWMYATRIPAMRAAKIDIANRRGGTGADLKSILPNSVSWKADNYNHLMEQPTLFYAVALVLALQGFGGGLNATIAWVYVGLRVLHSLVQVTSNRVSIRFLVFVLSTIALIMLTAHAAMHIVFHHAY